MNSIVPAGHERGVVRQAAKPAPQSELERVLEEWLVDPGMVERAAHHNALYSLSRIEFNMEELHSLVLARREVLEGSLLGTLFVSAAYKALPNRVIEYDLDVHLNGSGYGLSRDRLLVNRGGVHNPSWCFDGVFVNVESGLPADNPRVLMVNEGAFRIKFRMVDSNAARVSFRDAKNSADIYAALGANPKAPFCECPGHVQACFEELAEVCRGPIAGIYDRYGDVPAAQFRAEVYRLLGVKE